MQEFVNPLADLGAIEEDRTVVSLGATTSLAQARIALARLHPATVGVDPVTEEA